jgi:hypothetical protein
MTDTLTQHTGTTLCEPLIELHSVMAGIGATALDFLDASDHVIDGLKLVNIQLMVRCVTLRAHLQSLQNPLQTQRGGQAGGGLLTGRSPPTGGGLQTENHSTPIPTLRPLGNRTTVGQAFDYFTRWHKLCETLSQKQAGVTMSRESGVCFTLSTLKRWAKGFKKRNPTEEERPAKMPAKWP